MLPPLSRNYCTVNQHITQEQFRASPHDRLRALAAYPDNACIYPMVLRIHTIQPMAAHRQLCGLSFLMQFLSQLPLHLERQRLPLRALRGRRLLPRLLEGLRTLGFLLEQRMQDDKRRFLIGDHPLSSRLWIELGEV